MNFKIEDLLKALIPLLISAIVWLLNQVGSFNDRLAKIEGHMPALITEQEIGRAHV